MASVELLPCPFCGSPNAEVQVGYHMTTDAKVACVDCSAEGPLFGTDDSRGENDWTAQAIAAWSLTRELREAIGNEYMDASARRRLTAIADRLAALAPAGVGEDAWQREYDKEILLNLELLLRGRKWLGRWDEVVKQMLEELDTLTARPDSVSEAADAARYRFLRGAPARRASEPCAYLFERGQSLRTPIGGDRLDAAIDAALEAARAPGGVNHD
jgi:hypothetical protein